ncbi:MAG: M14 family zinc carboxypeptidase [Armatimonadota bacterium]
MFFQTPLRAGAPPRTRAESTDGRETSTLADVEGFVSELARTGAPLVRENLGRSAGGRMLPMVVAGRPVPIDGEDAHARGRIVVYVQANIHGGEVEGKEAVLALLRDFARHDPRRLLERLVLVVVPVFNGDGNEALGDVRRTRPHQDGPALAGERPNGGGLDLNRDAIKAEAPETRAVLEKVLARWDPDLIVDLHTTNGTRHGFHHTYAPPTHPNTHPGVLEWSRDHLLATVRRRLRREQGWNCFDYGNAETREGRRIWATFGEEGRYVTNYAGLRGSAAVLSEAVSFLPFPFRIETTRRFLEAVLEEAARDGDRLRALRGAAAADRPRSLGVRFAMDTAGEAIVPLEDPARAGSDASKAPVAWVEARLPVYDRWRAVRTATVPRAWWIPREHAAVARLLLRHGIDVHRAEPSPAVRVERFRIAERVLGAPFQGHRLVRLEGSTEAGVEAPPPGGFVVPSDQPRCRLAFHLLEPEGLDGVSAWNFLGDAGAVGGTFPIVKVV